MLHCEVPGRDKMMCSAVLNVGGRTRRTVLQIDTGASVSALSVNHARRLFKGASVQPTTSQLFGVGRKRLPVLGTLPATVTFDGRSADTEFFLIESSGDEAIMGLDLLRALQVTLHPATGEVDSVSISKGDKPEPEAQPQPGELQNSPLPPVTGYCHHIVLKPDAKPARFPLRRLPMSVRSDVSTEIQRLLQQGVIEPVEASEWLSPLTATRKKNGQLRLCVDLRYPNTQIVSEVHPLPKIEDLQTQLQGVVFSKLDLTSAYHQLELHPDSRNVTAFLSEDGAFRFRRIPFGLTSSGAAFQRLLDHVLAGIPGCVHYLDDIAVTGRNQEQHDFRLQQVLHRLKEVNLTINEAKSTFRQAQIDFCGYRLSAEGISPLQCHTAAITGAPPPATKKELRSFIGLCGWFSKFIPNYASTILPMLKLLRQDAEFEWTEDVDASFQNIKTAITSATCLMPFTPGRTTFVTTDASDRGLGAMLSQVDGGGTERAVAFWSRVLTGAESRYSVSEKETLSAVSAVERWRLYLWGQPFVLRTDHSALTTLLSPQSSGRAGARIARWQARLMPYTYTVVYTAGSKLPVADALSRLPGPGEMPFADDDIEVINLISEEHSDVLTADELQKTGAADPELEELRQQLQSGWPDSAKKCSTSMKPFYAHR